MANTTADKLALASANKTAIKAAIEAKNPTTAPTDVMSQWPTAIASIPTGTVRMSVWDNDYVNDGNQHIWIEIPEDNFTINCVVCTADYDWGDGTTEHCTANEQYSHTYATKGCYRIDVTNIALVKGPFFNTNNSDTFYPQALASNTIASPKRGIQTHIRLEVGNTHNVRYTTRAMNAVRMKIGTVSGNLKFMMYECFSAVYLDELIVTECTNAISMFASCWHLMRINGSIDIRNAGTDTTKMFEMCGSLEELPQTFLVNGSVDFNYCINLKKESIIAFVNQVNTCTNSGQTFTFAQMARNRFSDTEWAELAETLSAKNWGLSPAS